jgi:hypothetical protein
MKVDLKDVPTSQLQQIRQILLNGAVATASKADAADEKSYLCHKSPPKGYPEDKSSYGDPACYRYPLNTKARCLAAWRYIHQGRNKSILGGKYSKIAGKIKSYAKEHYGLDLEAGEAEAIDWEQAFVEYYDSETMGERCELIELEPENKNEEASMELNKDNFDKLEADLASVRKELDTAKSELTGKATELDNLTKQLKEQGEELQTLRKFKSDTEEAAARAKRLDGIKSKLDEANIEMGDPEYWLGLSDDVVDKTINMLKDAKKASSTASASIKVPRVSGGSDNDPVKVALEGIKELKKKQDK